MLLERHPWPFTWQHSVTSSGSIEAFRSPDFVGSAARLLSPGCRIVDRFEDHPLHLIVVAFEQDSAPVNTVGRDASDADATTLSVVQSWGSVCTWCTASPVQSDMSLRSREFSNWAS